MLTVIWDVDGFDAVDLMTERQTHNTHYFLGSVMNALTPIIDRPRKVNQFF
jgi:hypothetical protein